MAFRIWLAPVDPYARLEIVQKLISVMNFQKPRRRSSPYSYELQSVVFASMVQLNPAWSALPSAGLPIVATRRPQVHVLTPLEGALLGLA